MALPTETCSRIALTNSAQADLAAERSSGTSLSGDVVRSGGAINEGLRLQLEQPLHQRVILGVGYLRLVLDVVEAVGAVDPPPQILHFGTDALGNALVRGFDVLTLNMLAGQREEVNVRQGQYLPESFWSRSSRVIPKCSAMSPMM